MATPPRLTRSQTSMAPTVPNTSVEMPDAPPSSKNAHNPITGDEDDEFADLFEQIVITEKVDDDNNPELQQVYERHYVTWTLPESGFDQQQAKRAGDLMRATKEKKGAKGIDFCGVTNKWFFTKKMWAAASTQQNMDNWGWVSYTLTEADKKSLKQALSAGKIKNLHVI